MNAWRLVGQFLAAFPGATFGVLVVAHGHSVAYAFCASVIGGLVSLGCIALTFHLRPPDRKGSQ